VDEALAEGGIDNITVVLAEVVPSAPAQQSVVLGAAAERKIPVTGTRTDGVVPAGLERSPRDQPGASPAGSGPASTGLASTGSASTALTGITAGTAVGVGAESTQDPSGRPAAADQGDDEARYSPQPPAKRRFLRPLVGVLVLALILGAGLSAAYAWTRTQFYVGAAGDQVAIFQGLSDSLPGLSLSRLYEVQPLAVSALPPYYQDRVRASIDVANLAAARQTVGELSDAVKRCAAQAPSPRPNASVSTPSKVTTQPSATVSPQSSPATSSTPRAPAPAQSPASTSARTSPAATPDLSC
jgi:protein phosphatase